MPKTISKREFGERLERAKKIIEEKSLGTLIISSPADVKYVSNYSLDSSMAALVIIPAGHEPTLLIDQEWDLQGAKEVSAISDTRGHSTSIPLRDRGRPGFWLSAFAKDLPEILKTANVTGKIGVVGWSTFPTPVYLSVEGMIPKLQFEDVTASMLELRMIKSSAEVALLEEAAKITDEGQRAATEAISRGKTEVEIATAAETAMKVAGADSELSFRTMVGSGGRRPVGGGSLGGPTATKKKPEPGELVLMDMGARYCGYCGDITRTKRCRSLGQKQKDLFEVLSQIHKETIHKVRPGIRTVELNEIERQVARESGYETQPETGHGIGLEVHETPWFDTDDIELRSGMVITVEPGLYVPGVGGVRIEDMVLVTDTGRKMLTSFDRGP